MLQEEMLLCCGTIEVNGIMLDTNIRACTCNEIFTFLFSLFSYKKGVYESFLDQFSVI